MATYLLAGITCFGVALGQSVQAQPWAVDGKLIGKPKNGTDSKKSEDVSGVACETTSGFPRLCLVADDETQGVQIVILEDGRLVAGDFVRLIDDSFAGKPLELDAEGVAFAGGSFYVIGSHGRPRHEEGADDAAWIEARVKASSRIFRIRFAPDSIDTKTGKLGARPEITPSVDLTALIRAQSELAPFVGKPLEENGLTVEGVAVRDGLLYAGLRGPVPDKRRAAVISVPLEVLFGAKKGGEKLLRLELGVDSLGNARGVRDLVTSDGTLLVLAGPVNDPPEGEIGPGEYSVFSYGNNAEKLLDLDGYGRDIKPEALLPLGESDDNLKALLFFDGPVEGQPMPIEIELR